MAPSTRPEMLVNPGKPQHEVRKALAEKIETLFNSADIRILCFDLGVPYENIRGEIHSEKVRELIVYMARHERINDLLQECVKRRPDADWDFLKDDEFKVDL